MIDKSDITQRLKQEYNYAMSVYEYGSYVRLTNGSAAHYVDIRVSDDCLTLRGERYGEIIEKECSRDLDTLVSTLQSTI